MSTKSALTYALAIIGLCYHVATVRLVRADSYAAGFHEGRIAERTETAPIENDGPSEPDEAMGVQP